MFRNIEDIPFEEQRGYRLIYIEIGRVKP